MESPVWIVTRSKKNELTAAPYFDSALSADGGSPAKTVLVSALALAGAMMSTPAAHTAAHIQFCVSLPPRTESDYACITRLSWYAAATGRSLAPKPSPFPAGASLDRINRRDHLSRLSSRGVSETFLPIVHAALAEDVGDGDVTTLATVPETARAEALITQKAPGVVFGLDLAEATFHALDPELAIERLCREGEWRERGAVMRVDRARRARS